MKKSPENNNIDSEKYNLEALLLQKKLLSATVNKHQATIESLTQDNTVLTQKITLLKEMLRLEKSKRFGASSEKQESPVQASLFDEDDTLVEAPPEDETQETITYTRSKPKRNKPLDTSKLEREIRHIDLTDEEKICACGCLLHKFGEDTREELVYQPAVMKVIEHVRSKYTCKQCETVKSTPAIDMPLLKSKASAELIASVMLNKYHFHLPFYRQSQAFTLLHQIKIPDNTLGGWVMKGAEALSPLGDALWQQLAVINHLQVDETPVTILTPKKKAYMWLYHSPTPDKRFVIFDFSLSRGAAVVDSRLNNFKGLLQTDGYSGYNGQRARNDVTTLGCWDHARRKFMDVIKVAGNNKSGKAGQMVKRIAKLYEVEREIRMLPIRERKAIRQEKSIPILKTINIFLYKINAPPSSLLGKAVTYCKNQWPELIGYVDYGEAHISNCLTENQVRPFAIGRRNWMFVGNECSAQRAALIYSLIQSCTMNDINPYCYLVYVLKHVHQMRRKTVDPALLLPHTIDKLLLTEV